MRKQYQGSCHCGKVRFEAKLDLMAGTGKCNCSFCSKLRYWGAMVQPEDFRITAGEDSLGNYSFGTDSAQHCFCRLCGLHVFGRGYVEAIGGEFRSINVACLDGLSDTERAALPVSFADGRADNWWQSPAVTAHL